MSAIERFFRTLGNELWDAVKIGGKDISSGIKESIDFRPLFYIPVGKHRIPVTDTIISIIVAIAIIMVLAVVFSRNLNKRPGKRQALAEKLVETVLNLGKNNGLSDEQSKAVVPFTLSLGLYIIFGNLVSVLHLTPAARNPVFPITLAAFTLLYVIVMGIKLTGLKGFWYSLINPMPLMLPFSLLDYIIKPISLAFRLFGNVFGAYILLEFVSLVVPLFLPALLGLWFDIGDGIIQGLIFMFLSMNYIGEIVEKAESTRIRIEEKKAKKHAQVDSSA